MWMLLTTVPLNLNPFSKFGVSQSSHQSLPKALQYVYVQNNRDHHVITEFLQTVFINFVSEQGLCYFFFTRLTSALWVSVCRSVCTSVYIHIENLLFWLVCFSNHPEIKDNGSVLPGRRWANSQLAGHQFGRLPSSVLPGGKWCFVYGFIQCRIEFSFVLVFIYDNLAILLSSAHWHICHRRWEHWR